MSVLPWIGQIIARGLGQSITTTVCRRCLMERRLTKPSVRLRTLFTSNSRCGVFEPEFDTSGDIPEYDILNVNLKGYDFVELEAYSKYVHNTAKMFGFNFDNWPVPAKCLRVNVLKPRSTITEKEFEMKLYHRTIQLQDLPAIKLPLFLEVIRNNIPEGVELSFNEFNEEEDDFRYIPDLAKLEIQGQIAEMEAARLKKKK